MMNVRMSDKINPGQVCAIIPARSGSKGVIDKNIRLLDGFPMIAYAIVAAKLSKTIERALVSTDSEKYAEIAMKFGAEVPVLRPAEISQDNSTDFEFIAHMIDWLFNNEGTLPEYFVHLRPTIPLRNSEVIDEAVLRIKSDSNATSLRSAHATDYSPQKWFVKDNGYYKTLFPQLSLDESNGPRQNFEPVFIPNCYVDVLKTDYIIKNEKIHGDMMVAFETTDIIDIDTEEDAIALTVAIKESKSDVYEYLIKNYKRMDS